MSEMVSIKLRCIGLSALVTLTYMIASSSFIELKMSNPPSFHSPLSLV